LDELGAWWLPLDALLLPDAEAVVLESPAPLVRRHVRARARSRRWRLVRDSFAWAARAVIATSPAVRSST